VRKLHLTAGIDGYSLLHKIVVINGNS